MQRVRVHIVIGGFEDAVTAIGHVIKNSLYDGEVYNVVTINATVNDIIEEIKTHLPELKVEYVDSKIMNQLSYNVLGEKFENTGFNIDGSLQTAVSDTIVLLKGII